MNIKQLMDILIHITKIKELLRTDKAGSDAVFDKIDELHVSVSDELKQIVWIKWCEDNK